jgi:hypothetical protein
MGFSNRSGSNTFVNISRGKLVIKDKEGNKQEYEELTGTITGVSFADETYEGRNFEVLKIDLQDSTDRYQLKMRTDSAYFRTFCNFARSGDITKELTISPFYKEEDGKKSYTCFVKQDGKSLKATFTKDNQGDLPKLESREWKGNVEWDGSKQVEYWKNWLQGIKFEHAVMAGSATDFDEPSQAVSSTQKKEIDNMAPPADDFSDLPF